MKLRSLQNRLEDIGEAREVVVVIEVGPEAWLVGATVPFDVVGAEPDDKAAHEDGATVRLILRERPPAP